MARRKNNEKKSHASKTQVVENTQAENGYASFRERFAAFSARPLVKVLFSILAICFLLGLNLLISADELSLFSLLCGLEILLAIVIAWSLYFMKRQRANEREDDQNETDYL